MAEDTKSGDFDDRIEQAKKFLQLANEADSTNRSEALEDLRFGAGDQWPVEIQNSRTLEARPCLTINKIDPSVRQITNQIRQQRPRMKCHGMNSQSDKKLADIITGIFRHIEVQSDADQAYDNANDFQVRMGWGYWRVTTDYIADDSFDQEIYIKQITNPFTVYFDPNSVMPDGSDAEECMITEIIPKSAFRQMYPDAQESNFTLRGTGDSDANWVMKEDIRIAEYFYTVRTKTTLYMLSDGSKVFKDEYEEMPGIEILDKRETVKKEIHWVKMTAMEILEDGIWPGKYIPVVPVYGQQLIVDSKRKRFGLIRQAKDPQRMYNYWSTSMTESIALAPKAKWLLAEGQDEGHEQEWAQANTKAFPVLRYKMKDIEGTPAPVPTRIQPEPPPSGVMGAMAVIDQDLKSVLGVFDPNQIPTGNISGKALNGQQQQIDLTNYHYYDNFTRSLRWTGKIILDLIPQVYDTERVLRIIGDDGKPDLITLNERKVNEMGVVEVLNDVTVGEYDVVMDTGPGYNSKRQEAVDSMMSLLGADPTLMQTAGDLIFRNMDFPGSDVIADRMAAANPLAQIDEKSDVPPQVQMQLQQSQTVIKQLQQQIQQMQMEQKFGLSVKQMQETEETKRELMRQTARAHDIEMRDSERKYVAELNVHGKAQDADLKSQTQLEVEHIKAQVALLLAQIDKVSAHQASLETTERAV
jgi:hypothetical protein